MPIMPTNRTAHALLLALAAATAVAQSPTNGTVPGELVIEPPTLINLGFEWWIEGDDNRNASVAVSFRERGASEWRPALPLLRLHGERIYSESRVDVVAPNMFAGSILDLEPDTEYEARFMLFDPDGVRGEAERTAVVRTRAEPMPYRGGRTFHVYPHGYAGQKIEPAFEGLMAPITSGARAPTGPPPAGRASGPATRSSCTPAFINTTVTSTRTTPP